jgi:Tfp pilus assembly protein PilN
VIEINLLPVGGGGARKPSARRASGSVSLPRVGGDPRIAGLAAALVLGLLFAAYFTWTSGSRIAALNTEVEREQGDSVRLEASIARLKTLDTRRDTIDRKIQVIRSVDGRRFVWPHLMDEVSRATPPYLWLTKLAVADDAGATPAAPPPPPRTAADSAKAKADSAAAVTAAGEGPSFNVEGNAGNTQSLTRFMRNLEGSPMIRDVALVTSEQTDVQGRSVLKFTLEARWEDPDPAFVQTLPLVSTR